MAGTHEEKRKWLFDRYSRQLRFYKMPEKDIFVCPICWNGFRRAALEPSELAVSLAHIVPQSLGGRDCTLACTSCNNGVGSELEAHLVRRMIAEDRAAGIGRTDARLQGPFGEVGVEFQRTAETGGLSFYTVRQRSDLRSVAAMEQFFEASAREGRIDFEFTLKFAVPNRPKEVEAAFYQSAYLLMFSYFGYEFVAHPHYRAMRDRIRQPQSEGWKSPIAVMGEEGAARMLNGRNQAILFLREPPAIVAVLRFNASGQKARTFGVILPGLDAPTPPDVEATNFRCSIIPYRPDLFAKKHGCLRYVWQHTQQASARD